MGNSLDGKIALVTGGTSGIGLATAMRFSKEGAFVYVTGRRPDLVAQANSLSDNICGVQADVTDLDNLDSLFQRIKSEKGRLDVVFANAGNADAQKLGEITEASLNGQFMSHLRGTIFTVQKAVALMGSGGSIIVNSSLAASKGIEGFSAYGAMKAGVRSLARTWTTEFKGRNIRVNTVSPGIIVTPAYNALGEEGLEAFVEAMKAQIPLGRTGTAEEVAAAVLFLASDEASYISGVELFIDGGMAQV